MATEHDSQATTDHDTIREWAESRDGQPAHVPQTSGDGDAGLLRIEFDDSEDDLEPISWDEFFQKFDDENLAFLYQDETKGGGTSRFFKIVDRSTVDA